MDPAESRPDTLLPDGSTSLEPAEPSAAEGRGTSARPADYVDKTILKLCDLTEATEAHLLAVGATLQSLKAANEESPARPLTGYHEQLEEAMGRVLLAFGAAMADYSTVCKEAFGVPPFQLKRDQVEGGEGGGREGRAGGRARGIEAGREGERGGVGGEGGTVEGREGGSVEVGRVGGRGGGNEGRKVEESGEASVNVEDPGGGSVVARGVGGGGGGGGGVGGGGVGGGVGGGGGRGKWTWEKGKARLGMDILSFSSTSGREWNPRFTLRDDPGCHDPSEHIDGLPSPRVLNKNKERPYIFGGTWVGEKVHVQIRDRAQNREEMGTHPPALAGKISEYGHIHLDRDLPVANSFISPAQFVAFANKGGKGEGQSWVDVVQEMSTVTDTTVGLPARPARRSAEGASRAGSTGEPSSQAGSSGEGSGQAGGSGEGASSAGNSGGGRGRGRAGGRRASSRGGRARGR
ncbi:hypothetical protein CLOM_g4435 [Closterium sp. NIES-68]|nr:hypothetical protein CLOM_g4435 [Closterium sp. NIES-68]